MTSPGTQLVWALAAREAIAARREQIEPEHFLCALLKLAEIDDDTLKKLVGRSPDAEAVVIGERDRVVAALREWSVPETRVRRRLRRALGQGSHAHQGNVVHRSEASRALFRRAARIAEEGDLEAPHLLHALLAEPTPAIAKVIGEVGAAPPASEPRVPEIPEATPLLDRYTGDLASQAADGRLHLPDLNIPQVKVLSLAMSSTDPDPVLLICAPRVPLLPIVAHTALDLEGRQRLLELRAVHALSEAGDGHATEARLGELLDEAADVENLALFVDATRRDDATVLSLLSALSPALSGSPPRLVVAVDEAYYRSSIEPDDRFFGLWRNIWLHELTEADVPAEM